MRNKVHTNCRLCRCDTVWKISIKRDHDSYGKVNIFSVKSKFSLKRLLKSWFHKKIFSVIAFFSMYFSTLCVNKKEHWICWKNSWKLHESYKGLGYKNYFRETILAEVFTVVWKSTITRDHDFYGKMNIFSVKSTCMFTKEVSKELIWRIFLLRDRVF